VPTFTADWILPIVDDPLPGGFVTVEAGRITALGVNPPAGSTDLGRVALLPGVVNAHTHLELSYLHARVPPATSFSEWVRPLMALRRQYADPNTVEIVDSARAAIGSARQCGTALVGDIGNTLITVPLLREAAMPARVFYELLGFNVEDAETRVAAARRRAGELSAGDVRVALAPHAPYSVAPSLFRAIRADLDTQSQPVTSVHLGESIDEVEFVREATGPLRDLLEELGVWTDAWEAYLPSGKSPVEYLSDLGFLDRCVMAVHGVQFDGDDLSRLSALGITVTSCPRSNRYVGAGDPPIEAFYAMDVDVAFGTDSLASAPDLNVFSEVKEARRLAPRVSARRLLESATLVGARALGFGDEFGSIEPGKRAALIAVRIPEGVTDVEEFLVNGVEPRDIRWLDEAASRESEAGS
jgi:cytosine/adenosine deaminase-related metal-dependent hydrolase